MRVGVKATDLFLKKGIFENAILPAAYLHNAQNTGGKMQLTNSCLKAGSFFMDSYSIKKIILQSWTI